MASHWHKQTTGTIDPPGFWYTLDDPHVALEGADTAEITGSFTLFVNNVTIDVTSSDQGQWSNWTGYRESNPDSPAGSLENPAAKEYEVRSTTIHVVNGTLTIQAENAVDLYSKEVNAQVDGSISAPSVSGNLVSDTLEYRYEQTPLQMWGNGTLDLSLASDGAQDQSAPALSLSPSGSFDVQQTQGLAVEPADASGPWNLLSKLGLTGLLVLAGLAIGMTGVMVGATVPDRVHVFVDDLYRGWGDRQFDRLLREADMSVDRKEFKRARRYYRRAQRMDPQDPSAYTGLLTVAAELDGEPDFGDVIMEARDQLGTLTIEQVYTWFEYALFEHKPEHGVEAWLTLLEIDPEQAVTLYYEDRYGFLTENERVQEALDKVREILIEDSPEMQAYLNEQDPPDGPEIA